jgi:hypothetical protein
MFLIRLDLRWVWCQDKSLSKEAALAAFKKKIKTKKLMCAICGQPGCSYAPTYPQYVDGPEIEV